MAVPTEFEGFRFAGQSVYGLCPNPRLAKFTIKDSEKLTIGDMVNLESGEIDLAATADTAIVGAVQETKTGVDSTTEFVVIDEPFGLYWVWDTTDRERGATLDLAGTTGAQGIAASSNKEFIVWGKDASGNMTLVQINQTAASVKLSVA